MKYVLLLALCIAALPIHAADSFDYTATMALGTERLLTTPADFYNRGNVLVLGPEQSEEIHIVNGVEQKRIVPYFRNVQSVTKISKVVEILQENVPYQILLYLKDSNVPELRIEGTRDVLAFNQHPLKSGDILVITKFTGKK